MAARDNTALRRARPSLTVALATGMLAMGLGAGPLDAQTNDFFFRGWAWTRDAGAPRAAGLAGAAVALDDDLSALDANPALLTSLERTQVALGLARRGSGETSADDALLPETGLGPAAVAARLGDHWAVGFFRTEVQSSSLDITDQIAEAETTESGHLDCATTDAGAAVAVRLTSRFSLGVRVAATRFSVESEYVIAQGPGLPLYRVGIGDDATVIVTTVGVRQAPSRALSLGASFTTGGSWTLRRTSIFPRLDEALPTEATFAVRRPSIASAGAAWRAAPWLRAVAQVDRLSFGSQDENLSNETLDHWRERLGIELSRAYRSVAVQARAGVAMSLSWPSLSFRSGAASDSPAYSAPPDTARLPPDITDVPPAYWGYSSLEEVAENVWAPAALGSDSGAAATRRTVLTAGLSLVTRSGLRFDLAVRGSSLRIVTMAGATVRF